MRFIFRITENTSSAFIHIIKARMHESEKASELSTSNVDNVSGLCVQLKIRELTVYA